MGLQTAYSADGDNIVRCIALYHSRRFVLCTVNSASLTCLCYTQTSSEPLFSKAVLHGLPANFAAKQNSGSVRSESPRFGKLTVWLQFMLLPHYQLWGSHLVVCLLLAVCLLGLLFGPEVWGSKFLRNICKLFSDSTVKSHKLALLNITSVCHCSRMQSPWSRVLKKLTVEQLVKKFTAFYETWWLITLFTRMGRWSWTRPVVTKLLRTMVPWSRSQCLLPYPIKSILQNRRLRTPLRKIITMKFSNYFIVSTFLMRCMGLLKWYQFRSF
jgi:hypothetical protein